MTWLSQFVALFAVVLTAVTAWAEQPKVSGYPFPVPPLEVYDRLGKVGVGKVEPIPAADAKLLAAFWTARSAKPPKTAPQADDAAITLHLLASGVPEKDRAGYLKKFSELVTVAEKAVAGAKTDAEKADQLLRFLHSGVMAKGYVESETALHRVFDTGKFNCVSSSAMYFLVGTRLGLKLQPILIPGEPYLAGHAAVDLIDGTTRVQIEPTNPDGYDWPAKVKKPGVVVVGFQPDRKKGYDADGFGLAAAAASNLGTEAGRADPPRLADAVQWQAIALALDPSDPTAANNMIASVSNWGLKAKDAKQYEDAVALYAFGRAVFGDKGKLEHNYRVVWEHYLDEVFAAGKFEDGLKLVARAAAAFPKDKSFGDPAEWVTRAAHSKSEKDGWEAGLKFADGAITHLTGDAAKGVRAWKSKAQRQWSQKLLADGDPAGSLKVLSAGLKEAADDKELLAGLDFHAQEALDVLIKKDGPAAGIAHFKDVCKKFPKAQGVREAGFRHAARAASDLADAKKFSEAMKAADDYGPLAGDRAGEVRCLVFDTWAQSLATDGEWEKALGKYAEGLKLYPKDARLSNNAIATVDQWAEKSMKMKDWKEAIRIYEIGLKYFPDSDHLKRNRDYCVKQQK